MPVTAPRRALLTDLDSLAQARTIERADARRPYGDTVGRLRTASLLADQIVLTDAQLLDGAILLELGPLGVLDALGPPATTPRLVVICRAEGLGESLKMMAADATTGRMRPFEWSVLRSAVDPRSVATRLPGVDARSVLAASADDLPGALADALVQAGAPPAAADEIAGRWDQWLRHSHSVIHLERWAKNFGLTEALSRTGFPPGLGRPAEEFRRRVLEQPVVTRSKFLEELHDDRALVGLGAQLTRWFEAGYFRALAHQHDAAWLSFDTPSPIPARSVKVTTQLIERLDDLPAPLVPQLRHVTRAATERWTRKSTWWSMKSLTYAVLDYDEPTKLSRELGWAVSKIVAVLVAGYLLSDLSSLTSGILAVLLGLLTLGLGNFLEELVFVVSTVKGAKAGAAYISTTNDEPPHG